MNESKTADVSGVLTADIKLGKYAWLNIDSSKKVELDGAGHEITGLNAKVVCSSRSAAAHIRT